MAHLLDAPHLRPSARPRYLISNDLLRGRLTCLPGTGAGILTRRRELGRLPPLDGHPRSCQIPTASSRPSAGPPRRFATPPGAAAGSFPRTAPPTCLSPATSTATSTTSAGF